MPWSLYLAGQLGLELGLTLLKGLLESLPRLGALLHGKLFNFASFALTNLFIFSLQLGKAVLPQLAVLLLGLGKNCVLPAFTFFSSTLS